MVAGASWHAAAAEGLRTASLVTSDTAVSFGVRKHEVHGTEQEEQRAFHNYLTI